MNVREYLADLIFQAETDERMRHADARQQVRLVAALQYVLTIHQPETKYGKHPHLNDQYPCRECNRSDDEGLSPTPWPCPTVQAIERELGDES